jgi:hypothetical protein
MVRPPVCTAGRNFNGRLERLALMDQYYFGYQLHRRRVGADASRVVEHIKAALRAMERPDPALVNTAVADS